MKIESWLTTISIILFAVLLYFSTPLINLHEQAHCLGSKLIGRECAIRDNVTSIDKLLYHGEPGATLIYSGMPYLIMMIITFFALIFRRYWIRKKFNWIIYLILTLFLVEFVINLMSFVNPNDDFYNILVFGTFIDKIGIFFVIINFMLMSMILIFYNLKLSNFTFSPVKVSKNI